MYTHSSYTCSLCIYNDVCRYVCTYTYVVCMHVCMRASKHACLHYLYIRVNTCIHVIMYHTFALYNGLLIHLLITVEANSKTVATKTVRSNWRLIVISVFNEVENTRQNIWNRLL